MELHLEVFVVCLTDKGFVLGGNVLEFFSSRVTRQISDCLLYTSDAADE